MLQKPQNQILKEILLLSTQSKQETLQLAKFIYYSIRRQTLVS